jgi:hypothetical protein
MHKSILGFTIASLLAALAIGYLTMSDASRDNAFQANAGPTASPVQAPVGTQTPQSAAVEFLPSNDAKDILQFVLDQEGEPAAEWVEHDATRTKVVEGLFSSAEGAPVQGSLELSVMTSGASPTGDRFAALIQLATQENPPAEFPETATYACHLLVLARTDSRWAKESFDPKIYESTHSGGTRWAQECEFTLSWDDNRPVLSRKYTVGPYAGGVYVDGEEKIQWVDGRYKSAVTILREGPLDDSGEIKK